MMIHDITSQAGARKRRKRVGRGESSGLGKTSGRGTKGCQARSGGGTRLLHEGGQMPIFRRTPKRGFSNYHFRTEFAVVNVGGLEKVFKSGETVNPESLLAHSMIPGKDSLVKILGEGELTQKLTIAAHAFSAKAREIIEKAGGSVQVIERRDPAALAKAKRNSKKKARASRGKSAAKSAPSASSEQ